MPRQTIFIQQRRKKNKKTKVMYQEKNSSIGERLSGATGLELSYLYINHYVYKQHIGKVFALSRSW